MKSPYSTSRRIRRAPRRRKDVVARTASRLRRPRDQSDGGGSDGGGRRGWPTGVAPTSRPDALFRRGGDRPGHECRANAPPGSSLAYPLVAVLAAMGWVDGRGGRGGGVWRGRVLNRRRRTPGVGGLPRGWPFFSLGYAAPCA
jgi:hypothetical protein